MCVVSMVTDHYLEKWGGKTPAPYHPTPPSWYPPLQPPPGPPAITPEEIAEFRKLLDRARKYDKDNGEPDCEMEEKKQRLKKLAEELGVAITFDEQPDD